MLRTFAILVVAFSAADSALAADCQLQAFQSIPGADTSTHWAVRSGRPCTTTLYSHGGGATDMSIAQQAAHGRAGTPSVNQFGYVSQPGFVGKDSFVVARTAEVIGRRVYRGMSHYTVDVDVVP